MIFLNMIVEGQTEEAFVKQLLVPYLSQIQVFPTPFLITTGEGRGGMRQLMKGLKKILKDA